jgi:hypothetical protein
MYLSATKTSVTPFLRGTNAEVLVKIKLFSEVYATSKRSEEEATLRLAARR